jgi:hypothetical protein
MMIASRVGRIVDGAVRQSLAGNIQIGVSTSQNLEKEVK